MNTKEILQSNNFKFKKKFGQNFLLDDNILNNIVSLGSLDNDTLVIEIGVGAAALTKKTSKKAGYVLGYEIDSSLKEPLNEILKGYNNIDIIYDDFLVIVEISKNHRYPIMIVISEICYKICNGTYLKFSKMMKSNK